MQFIYKARHKYLLLESVLFTVFDKRCFSQDTIDLCCAYVVDCRMEFESLLLRRAQSVYDSREAFETFCALTCDELLAHKRDFHDFVSIYLLDLTRGRIVDNSELELLLREALTPVGGILCNRLLCFQQGICRCGPFAVVPDKSDIVCYTYRRPKKKYKFL